VLIRMIAVSLQLSAVSKNNEWHHSNRQCLCLFEPHIMSPLSKQAFTPEEPPEKAES
jgi:hypothetical protein